MVQLILNLTITQVLIALGKVGMELACYMVPTTHYEFRMHACMRVMVHGCTIHFTSSNMRCVSVCFLFLGSNNCTSALCTLRGYNLESTIQATCSVPERSRTNYGFPSLAIDLVHRYKVFDERYSYPAVDSNIHECNQHTVRTCSALLVSTECIPH